MEHNTKKKNRWKLVYNIAFFALMMALGAGWSYFIRLDGWLSIFGLLATCVALIVILQPLEKNYFLARKRKAM